MAFWKRAIEGWLMIDNRASGGELIETATLHCKHCQRTFRKNLWRIRARGYCPKCDSYCCDLCEAVRVKTGECRDFERFADEYLNCAAKGLPLPEFKPYG